MANSYNHKCAGAMSYDEKSNSNKWRFSREITFGDLLMIVAVGIPLIIAAVRLSDRVDDHAKRLADDEATLTQHATRLADHDTAIAVIEAKLHAP